MMRFGVLNLLLPALQLSVPSYALRLVRRFGAQKVGWFVVIAFASLAAMYLVQPFKPADNAPSGLRVDVVYAVASVLLLIGMGHLDTLCEQRRKAEELERKRSSKFKLELKQFMADLTRTNEELVQEVARLAASENALQASLTQYRALFTCSPLPMWLLDLRSCRFLDVNEAALRQYGFTRQEFMALTAGDLMPAGTAAAFLQDIAKPCSGGARRRWSHCRKDRTTLEVEVVAQDLRFGDCPARLMLAQDMSHHREREQELCAALKMESLGQVAGGVAHHFNNLLTIISGQTDLLLRKPQDPANASQLQQISAAGNRAAALIRQLLAAAGKQRISQEVLDLNTVLQHQSQMLHRLVGGQIVLQHSLGAHLPPILADSHVLEHVIINLVLNAREAMPTGGSLQISTSALRLDETQARGRRGARPGEFVRLTVRDTGCGMAPEVQERLFEPFVTTRDIGQATGLGLASVYGAVKQHAGWIEFSSQAGAGTEFRVFFPSAPPSTDPVRATLPAAKPMVKETILLVEPDERARGLARYILSRQGYVVIEADSAPTALTLWAGQASQIDLLLTDVVLPGDIRGSDLAEQLAESKPGLKVMFTSSSPTGDEGEEPPAIPKGLPFIPKPYSPDKLLQAIQSSLEAGKARPANGLAGGLSLQA